MSVKSRSGLVALSVITAVLLLGAGVVVGQHFLPEPRPEVLTKGEKPENFEVEKMSFADERTVKLSLEVSDDTKLISPMEGRVTESACNAGQTVSSGSVPLAVNGERILALNTSVPLWETLELGDEGQEVDSLRQEFMRMGADLRSEGPLNQAVINVFASLVSEEGRLEEFTEIPAERILWLPHQAVDMLRCSAKVGDTLAADSEYGIVAGGLQSASISQFPADLAPGDRVLHIAGTEILVDASGSVADSEDLGRIAESEEFFAARTNAKNQEGSEPISLVGQLKLVESSDAWVVPASAVFGVQGNSGCVTNNTKNYSVQIVGSQLGRTFIVPANSDAPLPTSVEPPVGTRGNCDGNE
ncbi:hypothetical protein EDF60_0036 [Leucobacter luti]|uniref:hypothetical protein n=1 Tax=Leucobacter luti TaxID=340320 RepID=UPI0010512CD8|nr:hypothetical protein [Leucobacter luti]MCW2289027.1 hypothetical protein [Leucobacter luti]TCK44829.1 hypothetical protein EDF60_0036 [Leucobacter luti]